MPSDRYTAGSARQRAFDADVWVHYGQLVILSGAVWDGDVLSCFRKQSNGILGTAQPGVLLLLTGLHTGRVHVAIDIMQEARGLDIGEDCVETSFIALDRTIRLIDWNGTTDWEFALGVGTYRVRCSARGMDAARNTDTLLDEQEAVDTYVIQFWPDELVSDRVIRQTSHLAEYLHREMTKS